MNIAYIYIYSRGLKEFFSYHCVSYTKQTKLQTRKIENKTLLASPFCTGKAERALVPVLLPHHTLCEERTAGFIAQSSPTLQGDVDMLRRPNKNGFVDYGPTPWDLRALFRSSWWPQPYFGSSPTVSRPEFREGLCTRLSYGKVGEAQSFFRGDHIEQLGMQC